MSRIRYALRSLAKAPLLSLVVVLSLALGIGANTAIFSLLHQVILSALPVQHPEQLVLITAPRDSVKGRGSTNNSGDMTYAFSHPFFRELEKHPQGLTALAGFHRVSANLAFRNQTVNGSLLLVSGAYFPMLGVRPHIGRLLEPADDRDGAGNPVAVLGYGWWRDKLGAGPGVLNQSIHINGHVFTVVGIAPPGFDGVTFGDNPSAFVPICFKPQMTPNWNGTADMNDYWVYLVGRLKRGLTRPQAAAALNGTYATLVEQHAATVHWPSKEIERYRQSRLKLVDGSHGHSAVTEMARTPLLILMCATALVLLIAMANAANLLLARSAGRRRELAIRAAMGAGRRELMTQLLIEALILALAGGAGGILLGAAGLKALIAWLSTGGPISFLTAQLQWPVLWFCLALSIATGLLFGLYPAWDGARTGLATTLKDESGQSSGTRGAARIRQGLVCAQVMISAILLIPTGLFLKSLVNILHIDLGINTENLLVFTVEPALNGYKFEQNRALFERIETELAAIPGVRSVTASLVPLIAGDNWISSIVLDGRPKRDSDDAAVNEIGCGYFAKMGIPLVAGREFTGADNAAGPPVAIVNRQFVKKFLDGRNPIGVRMQADGGWMEIVGVVRDSHYSGVKEKVPAVFYMPWRQDKHLNGLNFYVRTALAPQRIFPEIRRAMAHIDRTLPVENLGTMEQQIDDNIIVDRFVLNLAAAFAVLATVLAMLGVYGVMAHSVTRRTREIGIRMALGAAPARIRGMVLRELLWILGIALAAGIPAALVLAKLTESQLYGVKSRDLLVVISAALALALTAILAGWLPARRAARVSPMDALRYE